MPTPHLDLWLDADGREQWLAWLTERRANNRLSRSATVLGRLIVETLAADVACDFDHDTLAARLGLSTDAVTRGAKCLRERCFLEWAPADQAPSVAEVRP